MQAMVKRLGKGARAAFWLLCAAAAPALAAESRFGYLGLSPAVAGETLAQAEGKIASPLAPLAGQPAKADGACQPRAVASQPSAVYIVDEGVLSRVETRDARYATVSGVRVGDDVAKAKRIYGKRLEIKPHAYFERGPGDSIFKRPLSFPMAPRTRRPTRLNRSFEVAEIR